MGKVLALRQRKAGRADRVERSLERRDAEAVKLRRRMRYMADALLAEAEGHVFRPELSAKERIDSWLNTLTRIGDPTKDKRFGASFYTDRLHDFEAEDLWRGSDIAARIIELVPDEIIRGGWKMQITPDEKKAKRAKERGELEGGEAPGGIAPRADRRARRRQDRAADVFSDSSGEDDAKELGELVDAAAEDLGITDVVGDALKAERAFGGSAIFMGVNDGVSDLTQPLNLGRVRSLDFLAKLTPIELIPYQWYENPVAPKFGEPELYWMQRLSSGPVGSSSRIPVHESRLVLFPGIVVTQRQRAEHWGWGDSILVRIRNVLRDFDATWDAAAVLVQDFAQMVWKMKGLNTAILNGKPELVAERAKAAEEGRSIVNALMIDADDEAKRETTSVTGLPDMIDRRSSRMAAAGRMPVTLLMGESPGGLSSTGENEIRNFMDSVAAHRNVHVRPRLNRIYKVLLAAKEGPAKGREPAKWKINFGTLWQLDDVQKSTARKNNADADNAYIGNGTLMPEEVAKSRFGGPEYGEEIHLNRTVREAYDREADQEAEQAAAQLQAEAEAKVAAAGQAPGTVGGGDPDGEEPQSRGEAEKPAKGPKGKTPPPAEKGDAREVPADPLAALRDLPEHPSAMGKVAVKHFGFKGPTVAGRALRAAFDRDELRATGTRRSVAADEIRATQLTVDRAKVAGILGSPEATLAHGMAIRDEDGGLHLLDGHHRAAAQALRGQSLEVELMEWPEPKAEE